MRTKYIFALIATSILAGCSTSGQTVKERNILNVFITKNSPEQAAARIIEMSKYCSSNIYKIEQNKFPTINKVAIDYKIGDGPNQFYGTRIEIDGIEANTSKVNFYHYFNNDGAKRMAKQVEKWLNSQSTECVPGF